MSHQGVAGTRISAPPPREDPPPPLSGRSLERQMGSSERRSSSFALPWWLVSRAAGPGSLSVPRCLDRASTGTERDPGPAARDTSHQGNAKDDERLSLEPICRSRERPDSGGGGSSRGGGALIRVPATPW